MAHSRLSLCLCMMSSSDADWLAASKIRWLCLAWVNDAQRVRQLGPAKEGQAIQTRQCHVKRYGLLHDPQPGNGRGKSGGGIPNARGPLRGPRVASQRPSERPASENSKPSQNLSGLLPLNLSPIFGHDLRKFVRPSSCRNLEKLQLPCYNKSSMGDAGGPAKLSGESLRASGPTWLSVFLPKWALKPLWVHLWGNSAFLVLRPLTPLPTTAPEGWFPVPNGGDCLWLGGKGTGEEKRTNK